MVLDAYEVPLPYNLVAAFSTWILLAGYVVLPGAFKSLDWPMLQDHILPGGNYQSQQTAIFSVASVCCAVGLLGISWLWLRFRHNYIWLIGSLILYVARNPPIAIRTVANNDSPSMWNSASALLTVLISVYATRGGYWSESAIVTLTIIVLSFLCTLVTFVVYRFWFLESVKVEAR